MRKVTFIAVFLFVVALFIGCGGENYSAKSNETARKSTVSDQTPETFIDNANVSSVSGTENESTANPQAPVSLDDAQKTKETEPEQVTERKIIRNAELQLETSSPDESQQKITAIANNKKGFVIASTTQNTGIKSKGRNSVSMKIRVPAENFQETLAEIRKVADRVVVETVTGKDVTEEFVDVLARLKTKKALEERYLEIMKRANSVKDALEVEAQLANVRTEIERIEGRKRFLENQSSLSTIEVELKTPVELSASSTGFVYELKQSISDGFESALAFVLFLVQAIITLLPFLLFVVLPIFLILRYFFRKYKRKITARKIVEEEPRESKIIDVE